MSNDCTPEEERKESGRDDNRLETEEIAKSVHGKTGDSRLDHPIEENHKKSSTGDIGAGWKSVVEIVIGRPDGGDHVLKISTTLDSCDGSPLLTLAGQSLRSRTMSATKVRTRMAGIQPHIPKETRATTGKGV